MRGGSMAIESIDRYESELKRHVFTDKERAEVMRVINEYDFVCTVLKHKAALMPEDLVHELAQQNDINQEIIVMSLSLALPLYV
jgi:hypothetical protein